MNSQRLQMRSLIRWARTAMQMLADQCALLKVIAENQQKLAKIMKAGPSLNFPPPGVPPHMPSGPGVGSSPTRLASMYHAAAGSQASPATPPAPAFMGFCATAIATCALGTRLWWLQLLLWNQRLHKKFLTRTLGPSMSLMRMGLQGLYRLAQKGQTRFVAYLLKAVVSFCS